MRVAWPEWLEDTWAKSPAPGESRGESLARHTFAALSRLVDMMRLRPDLPSRLGFPSLWRCTFWACFLHDWGKSAAGFQAWLRGGLKWGHRHEIVSLVFLDWIGDGLDEQERWWVAAAIASHHRDIAEIMQLYPNMSDPQDDPLRDPLGELDPAVVLGLHRWLVDCAPSWADHFGLSHLVLGERIPGDATAAASGVVLDPVQARAMVCEQGLPRVRRWLKGYRRLARSLEQGESVKDNLLGIVLRGHMTTSDHTASAHTGDLPRPVLGRGNIRALLHLDENRMYEHQRRSGAAEGSAILVAPTGSGKTESALLWAHTQSGSLHYPAAEMPASLSRGQPVVPRLFYMLPYQASMNAMYERLQGSFPGQVGLEHSHSKLAIYRAFLDHDVSPREAARMARWERNLARLHYYPIRILTPYQMLKGPYRLKGYEALLTDFFGATCILDEIHAYEPKRLALILATVKYLAEHCGTRFFVMSATLPSLVLARVVEAVGDCHMLRATPELFTRFRRHRLHVLPGDLLEEEALARVEGAARAGQSVLVCCNTVKRAQALYDELRDRLAGIVPVLLLHGRFNGRDRLLKESRVRKATGSRSEQRQPIVLVATQVVEVSLDIDLDTIYSDPAPLEALIQRFGRVNRRHRKEWAPVHVFTRPDDGQHVYDPGLVKGALRVLQENEGFLIDEEAISDWLDRVYEGEVAAAWEREFRDGYDSFLQGPLSSLRPFAADEGLEEEFYRAFDGLEVLPAGLEAEFQRLVEEEPLTAGELLVPITFGQYARLRSQGKVLERQDRRKGWPRVVEADYSSEYGLALGTRG